MHPLRWLATRKAPDRPHKNPGGHIVKRATLTYDRERPWDPGRENSFEDGSYKVDYRNPTHLEAMELVNNLCS